MDLLGHQIQLCQVSCRGCDIYVGNMTCTAGQSGAKAVELARPITQLIEFLTDFLQEQVITFGVDVTAGMSSVAWVLPFVAR